MSEITAKGYITKKEKNAGEFEDLYVEGIQLLQELSGAHWTDYNEHDPGVTILENLAYTFTNLSYKTSLPIKDILTESKGTSLTSGDNGFFLASEILTTNPITTTDFRKVFIDQITNVKNVWVKPQGISKEEPVKHSQSKLTGIYNIYVELYYYTTNSDQQKREEDRIKKEIKNNFNSCRNLCEDICDIIILKPIEFEMKLHVTLESGVHGEEILAKIYHTINNYLARTIKFHSLWELQFKRIETNSIFNGPALENGFIESKQLTAKKNSIKYTEILKAIGQLEGIISIEELIIKTKSDDEQAYQLSTNEDVFLVPVNRTPVLLLPKSNIDLVFRERGINFKPDMLELNNEYSNIIAKNYGNFKSVSKAINTINIPVGENFAVSSYYPIREQFPAIYGIGKYGLQKRLPKLRYAQANQLKAYLLPLDQLMNNFLAQLTNIYTIFDPESSSTQSFFYKSLDDMPSLVGLVKQEDDIQDDIVLQQWNETLKNLNAQFDTEAIHRLNDAADFILARFGEKFPTTALKKINHECYGKRLHDPEFETSMLLCKRALIAKYASLSYNRSKGQNLYHTAHENEDISMISEHMPNVPIAQKVAMLMGIKNFHTRPLFKAIENSRLKFKKKDTAEDTEIEITETMYPKEDIDIIDVTYSKDNQPTDKKLQDRFRFEGNSKDVLKNVLKYGVIESNYSIKKIDDGNHKSYYKILFTNENGIKTSVHTCTSEQVAKKSIKDIVTELAMLNDKSEGFHTIEHLLFAPPLHKNNFGYTFSIKIAKGTSILFEQENLKTYTHRNNTVKQILEGFTSNNNITFTYKKSNEKYSLQIINKNNDVLAVSHTLYTNEDLVNDAITAIKNLIHQTDFDGFFKKLTYYSYYGKKRVNETFFSFKMSFVLPAWPTRFQNANFKSKIKSFLSEYTPIHIAFHTYWLDYKEMVRFEKKYLKWMNISVYNSKKMKLTYALIQKLRKYHKIYCN